MNPPNFDPKHVRLELVGDRLFWRRFALIKLVKLDGSLKSAPIDLSDRQIDELENILECKGIKAVFDRIGMVRNSFVADCRGMISSGIIGAIEQIRQAIQDYFRAEARTSCLNCLACRQECSCVLY